MSDKGAHENAEMEYINIMLDIGDLSVVDSDANIASDVCLLTPDRNNDELYQLFLVSGLKVAVLSSEILTDVDIDTVDVVGDVLTYDADRFKVIDIRCLINPSEIKIESGRFILLKNRKLALTCEESLGHEAIDEKIICWRNENSHHVWLAGTVKEKNIILLDVQSLQKM